MEVITFEKLVEEVGIGSAVVICQRMLSDDFFKGLGTGDWLEIYKTAELGSDLKQRALNIIKETIRFEIRAPLIGTFGASGEWPSGDKEPLVKIGDRVEPETVVCGIEALMVQNPVKAGVYGIITEVRAEDGQAVEFNQVLFKVKPVEL